MTKKPGNMTKNFKIKDMKPKVESKPITKRDIFQLVFVIP